MTTDVLKGIITVINNHEVSRTIFGHVIEEIRYLKVSKEL